MGDRDKASQFVPQRVDPELTWVVRWRETGEEPTEGELFIGDSRSKYYWINREVFVLEKGFLFSRKPTHLYLSPSNNT
jgi:hypothetical protein